MTPNDRKYTKEHEWLLIEGNVAKIGITDHAQDALGDIVYVELPAVGDAVEAIFDKIIDLRFRIIGRYR